MASQGVRFAEPAHFVPVGCHINASPGWGHRWGPAPTSKQELARAAEPSLTLPLKRDALEGQVPHNVWTSSGVHITQTSHGRVADWLAQTTVSGLRQSADVFSGFAWRRLWGTPDERAWLRRLILLEAVVGAPGRFAEALGSGEKLPAGERGWLRAHRCEAEMSRMHLSIEVSIHKSRPAFLALVDLAGRAVQRGFGAVFLASPNLCHVFAEYLEEEAVTAYTNLMEEMDAGRLPELVRARAPPAACKYYGLAETASLQDVFNCIRADELLAR